MNRMDKRKESSISMDLLLEMFERFKSESIVGFPAYDEEEVFKEVNLQQVTPSDKASSELSLKMFEEFKSESTMGYPAFVQETKGAVLQLKR